MPITQQQWRPDTCQCIVEEQFDTDTPDVKMASVVRKCADHAAVPDADLYGVLYANPDGENRTKNLALAWLVANGAVTAEESSERISWGFTGSGATRTLSVRTNGAAMTGPQRAAFASAFAGRRVALV